MSAADIPARPLRSRLGSSGGTSGARGGMPVRGAWWAGGRGGRRGCWPGGVGRWSGGVVAWAGRCPAVPACGMPGAPGGMPVCGGRRGCWPGGVGGWSGGVVAWAGRCPAVPAWEMPGARGGMPVRGAWWAGGRGGRRGCWPGGVGGWSGGVVVGAGRCPAVSARGEPRDRSRPDPGVPRARTGSSRRVPAPGRGGTGVEPSDASDRGQDGGGQAGQVGRGEFDLQAAPPGRDADRPVPRGRRVQDRRQPLALAQG